MREQQAKHEAYAALLGRLPKFLGDQMPHGFLQALEKQLKDHEVSEARWLTAMESCLEGKALTIDWNLIDTSDREDYASAKQAIMRCLGPPIATRIDQVGVLRWSKEESVAEMWEEVVQHVKSFVCEEDVKGDVSFRWMLTRALAKCKRECADAIRKQRPKSVPQAIALMKEWEHKYGSAVKVWVKKPEVVADKKASVITVVPGRKKGT